MTASAPATAAVMVHNKLTTEAGAQNASAAAAQAKLKLQKKHQQELLEAALTVPQQRTQAQVGWRHDDHKQCHTQLHPKHIIVLSWQWWCLQHACALPAKQLPDKVAQHVLSNMFAD